MNKNAIQVICPYFHAGTWVFDDEACGLVKEPFVSGVPEIIDSAVTGIPDAKSGFRMLFSENPFPGSAIQLDRRNSEAGGWWYRLAGTKRDGWLCPAMFNYFDSAPRHIFVAAEPLRREVTVTQLDEPSYEEIAFWLSEHAWE